MDEQVVPQLEVKHPWARKRAKIKHQEKHQYDQGDEKRRKT